MSTVVKRLHDNRYNTIAVIFGALDVDFLDHALGLDSANGAKSGALSGLLNTPGQAARLEQRIQELTTLLEP